METLLTIKVSAGSEERELQIGVLRTSEELDAAYRFRYREYSKRNYLVSSIMDKERDEHDDDPSTVHVGAMLGSHLIGYIRMIRCDILPTEQFFHFKEPEKIASIPRQSRAELGRFIIVPPENSLGGYLPRGLVMLSMFIALSRKAEALKIGGGMAFIKKNLQSKLRLLRVPFHEINTFDQRYPEDGAMKPYFEDKRNPVLPIYFSVPEFRRYCSKLSGEWGVFKETAPRYMEIRENLYTSMLRSFGIL